MLLFDSTIWLIGIVLLLIVLLILRRMYHKSLTELLLTGLFGIYLLNVIKYTFFPFPVDSQLLELMRITGGDKGMVRLNLIPFHSQFYDSILVDKSNYLNVLMTIPYGLLLPLLISMTTRRMLLFAVGIGLVIETLQGMIDLLLGFTYRTVDVNDIIFNFTGAMLGWAMLRLLLRSSIGQKQLARWFPAVVQKM
ncbi:VanZ family protein [Paenibacillus sp. WLX2291]|uniref:VanZ family protein n=1 Tax=Paenibacillus sp. WLX2291 TaxID=3296934 RepID=UPI00398421DD